MVNTTALSLQACADLAGTRATPYPEQVAAHLPDHRCRACGADLAGVKSSNPYGTRVYCSVACQRLYQRRWRERSDDTARLVMVAYTWNEW